MVAYRVYCLDGVNRVQGAEWVEAPDDEVAITLARGVMRESPKCEVWDGNRLVARLTSEDWPESPDAA